FFYKKARKTRKFLQKKGCVKMYRLEMNANHRPRLLFGYADSSHAVAFGRYFRRLGWEVRKVASAAGLPRRWRPYAPPIPTGENSGQTPRHGRSPRIRTTDGDGDLRSFPNDTSLHILFSARISGFCVLFCRK